MRGQRSLELRKECSADGSKIRKRAAKYRREEAKYERNNRKRIKKSWCPQKKQGKYRQYTVILSGNHHTVCACTYRSFCRADELDESDRVSGICFDPVLLWHENKKAE